MKNKFNSFFLCLFFFISFFYQCEKEPYIPPHENKFAIYANLDPDIPIELMIWKTVGLGQEEEAFNSANVEIYKDEVLIYSITTSIEIVTTDIFPEIGSFYQIKVTDPNNQILNFESRPVKIYNYPEINSYTANDSLGVRFPNSSQTLHQFKVNINTDINNSPYFAYNIMADSLPNEDESPVEDTGSWFKTGGINCLEIGESPYFDRILRAVNLTCFESDPSITFETSNYRPGDVKKLYFTLCNFDTHTMDFSRWLFQNFPFNSDFPLEQIFTTKDNFESYSGYDFIVNRTCKEFDIEFN